MILSVEFINNGENIVVSSNCTRKNASSKALAVFDFDTGCVLSNNIYTEGYTCTKIKLHPSDKYFVVQSNHNYLKRFSCKIPFRKTKNNYSSHYVSGYNIGFDITPDGKYICSGSSDGSIIWYDWITSC